MRTDKWTKTYLAFNESLDVNVRLLELQKLPLVLKLLLSQMQDIIGPITEMTIDGRSNGCGRHIGSSSNTRQKAIIACTVAVLKRVQSTQ